MEKLSFKSTQNINPEHTPLNSVTNEKETSQEELFIGKTKDGMTVYDRNDYSHVHSKDGLTRELLQSALSVVPTNDQFLIEKEVPFDGVVGQKTCVKVGPNDEVIMMYRKNRHGRTPMVKNRESEPSNKITVVFRKSRKGEYGDYTMLTSYIGDKSEKEPWDTSLRKPEDRKRSKEFWENHALIYDESEIDWERTNALNEMDKEEKELELMSDKVFYEGLFVDSEDLYKKIRPRLARRIRDPHITTKFNPRGSDLNLRQLGTGARILVEGYGNDGKNEGLLVRIKADDPVIQEICDKLEVPYIALSISEGSKPQDTEFLDFKPVDKPFELKGEYGLFSQGSIIDSESDAEQLRD